MSETQQADDPRHGLGEPEYLTSTGTQESDALTGAEGQDRPHTRGLGSDRGEERADSGFFGVGSNDDEGDDNLARETTPGYQADKADRGTIMPR
jgi:hypothetical protein